MVLATLFVPPFGAALAFMARWDKAGRAVTVVLAAVWFVVLLAAVSSGQKPVQGDAKPQVQPVVTVTVTAVPPPAPVASSKAPVAFPSPPTPPAPTSSAPASAAAVAPPAERPPVPRPATADDGKTPSRADAPAITRPSSDDGSASSSGSGGGVSYRNCTAVRQAGAAPIRRGDAGYGSHLDRDGDGIACE
ncbi:excalibur calcium-binding domain-containing protein [Streptomyces sp. WM4235]|uniref:excalibur calcium-binding domain-containing protein n=1 Tax=Streptomyces sp. WM4235 TaxID=1415551 RepID=UPI001F197BFD|nr:excalibur calcium-binding domain-containing protein [Streptomyces sp. WM4235]